MIGEINEVIEGIKPVDKGLETAVQARLDDLTKPRGSLGRLEEAALRFALIKGSLEVHIPSKRVYVFAGDHGVTEEGVSAFPREVTYQMVKNFLTGGAGINVLARHVGAEVKVVDIGVDHDFQGLDGLIHRKVRPGTANMAKGPAMSLEEAGEAVMAGVELAREAAGKGVGMLATGEMGIGNTTAASAVTAAICRRPPEEVTGRGTGIGDEALAHKVAVIRRALEVNSPDPSNPVEVLAGVGGLEIAGICGLVLGAAASRLPVVIDGFISTAGALVSWALAPSVTDYVFAAHRSVEQGHRVQLQAMGLRPLLDLDMRLGEGTGAALAMNIIDAGIRIYNEMATFSGASVAEGNEEI